VALINLVLTTPELSLLIHNINIGYENFRVRTEEAHLLDHLWVTGPGPSILTRKFPNLLSGWSER